MCYNVCCNTKFCVPMIFLSNTLMDVLQECVTIFMFCSCIICYRLFLLSKHIICFSILAGWTIKGCTIWTLIEFALVFALTRLRIRKLLKSVNDY